MIFGINQGIILWYPQNGAPKTFIPGFNLEDVSKNNYGRHIHFWNFKEKR